jgi:magnesium-transporting ATPase (P-type)
LLSRKYFSARTGLKHIVPTFLTESLLRHRKYSLNTFIGVFQEGSAEKAADALKSMLSSHAVLVRDGKEVKVPASDIVPGDVVILQTGDRVPGDIRLLEVNNLACQEAALTGESVPIDKVHEPIAVNGGNPKQTPLGDRKNMCFSATLVSQGYGVGLVVCTGDNTEIGTINKLVNKVEEKKTAVLEQIDFIAKCLAGFIFCVAVSTWFAAFFRLNSEPLDALTIALTCAVAMIPEGLDAIVTMTYSWSVSKMAKENAIIRKLPAVETLGSVSVICSDKTGTLTKNEMSLVAFVTSNAHYKNDVDNKTRTVGNFVRDDTYLATRAGHSKGKSTADVIHSGPSAHQTGKPSAFGYSMHGPDSYRGARDDGLVEDLASPEDKAHCTTHNKVTHVQTAGQCLIVLGKGIFQ